MEVILIRHGEPRYDEVDRHTRGDFGRLTARGAKQAEARASDPRLEGATLIVSSPYTRSLQSAAIISRITDLPLEIEHDLREWTADVKYQFDYDGEEAYKEYIKFKGKLNKISKFRYETYESVQKRVRNAIEKYEQSHEKIIVVCHGIVMSSQTFFEDLIEHCGVRAINI
ncbi:MAG TPA: histidine phosphatase family protein [Bacilli bacterium]|nr:histidine phosphatase family protein [Bacilli bacterium]